MKSIAKYRSLLKQVFSSQNFASMATLNKDGIHNCLVAFSVSEDLKTFFLCTPRTTRKYANLLENPTVSMLIHNSSNQAADLKNAVAVTVAGKAQEVSKEDRQSARQSFIKKHPYMKDFVMAKNTALITVYVTRYDIVTHFQDVSILDIQNPLDLTP